MKRELVVSAIILSGCGGDIPPQDPIPTVIEDIKTMPVDTGIVVDLGDEYRANVEQRKEIEAKLDILSPIPNK